MTEQTIEPSALIAVLGGSFVLTAYILWMIDGDGVDQTLRGINTVIEFFKSYAKKRIYEASFWIGVAVIILTIVHLESLTILLACLLTIVPDASVKEAVRKMGGSVESKLDAD